MNVRLKHMETRAKDVAKEVSVMVFGERRAFMQFLRRFAFVPVLLALVAPTAAADAPRGREIRGTFGHRQGMEKLVPRPGGALLSMHDGCARRAGRRRCAPTVRV